MMATTVSAATAQNAERQPANWPSQVPAGTPSTLATVSPPAITASARPRRSVGTIATVVTAATAQNPAAAAALTTRDTNSSP